LRETDENGIVVFIVCDTGEHYDQHIPMMDEGKRLLDRKRLRQIL